MRLRSLPWLVGVLLAVSACATSAQSPTTRPAPTSSPEESPASAPATDFPVTVAGVTIEAWPERVVSLSATHTEILFAIGAGDQVAAVDRFSNHPPEAAGLPQLDAFEPNVEAIADTDPDLVITAFDPGDLVASLEAIGIPALLLEAPEDMEGVYRQIEEVGMATGHGPEATGVAARIAGDLTELSVQLRETRLSYYYELDPTYSTITSGTFLGDLYQGLGLENIADRVGSSPYPQLSAEYVIESDPDLILLADTKCCQVTAETVAGRPGWGELTAVRTGGIVELDDDVASRWGPRVVELAAAVVEAVERLQPVGG